MADGRRGYRVLAGLLTAEAVSLSGTRLSMIAERLLRSLAGMIAVTNLLEADANGRS
jgi:hypothetical protein